MCLIRIGYRTVNLEYLIELADSARGAPPDEAPPGGIRLSVFPGKVFDVSGDDAAALRLHVDRLTMACADSPAQGVRPKATIGRGVPPRTSALPTE